MRGVAAGFCLALILCSAGTAAHATCTSATATADNAPGRCATRGTELRPTKPRPPSRRRRVRPEERFEAHAELAANVRPSRRGVRVRLAARLRFRRRGRWRGRRGRACDRRRALGRRSPRSFRAGDRPGAGRRAARLSAVSADGRRARRTSFNARCRPTAPHRPVGSAGGRGAVHGAAGAAGARRPACKGRLLFWPGRALRGAGEPEA